MHTCYPISRNLQRIRVGESDTWLLIESWIQHKVLVMIKQESNFYLIMLVSCQTQSLR